MNKDILYKDVKFFWKEENKELDGFVMHISGDNVTIQVRISGRCIPEFYEVAISDIIFEEYDNETEEKFYKWYSEE